MVKRDRNPCLMVSYGVLWRPSASSVTPGRLHKVGAPETNQPTNHPYVGADFTEYQWRRCRTMIGEKPKRPGCILCVFKAYSASKKY